MRREQASNTKFFIVHLILGRKWEKSTSKSWWSRKRIATYNVNIYQTKTRRATRTMKNIIPKVATNISPRWLQQWTFFQFYTFSACLKMICIHGHRLETLSAKNRLAKWKKGEIWIIAWISSIKMTTLILLTKSKHSLNPFLLGGVWWSSSVMVISNPFGKKVLKPKISSCCPLKSSFTLDMTPRVSTLQCSQIQFFQES